MRLRLAAAAAVLAVCMLVAAQGLAAAPLTIGFSNAADPLLTGPDATSQSMWVSRAHAVGAQMVKLVVSWAHVAPAVKPRHFDAADPSNPAYNWTALDQSVRDLHTEGFKILLTVITAPKWAEGADIPKRMTPGVWEPNAGALASFATALARRYDGHYPDPLHRGSLPRVAYWQAWNEPNLSIDLAPQWLKTPSGPRPYAPALYRSMENQFYLAVKGVERSNFVVQAGLAPYGDYPPGGPRMAPVTFDQAMFCLNSKLVSLHCSDPVHLDAIDSHPYGVYGPNWHALDPGDVAVPDVYKLTRVLRAAESAGMVLPRGPKQNWVTEISWDTKPPNPHGVPVLQEAHWLEQSFYVLWRQGVNTILWFQLGDAPPIPSYELSYEGGVYFLNGGAKPGATAFHFPFVTNRLNPTTVDAWGRTPAAGTVSIEEMSASGWKQVAQVNAGAGQVFQTKLELTGSAVLRATVAGEDSLTWNQSG